MFGEWHGKNLRHLRYLRENDLREVLTQISQITQIGFSFQIVIWKNVLLFFR